MVEDYLTEGMKHGLRLWQNSNHTLDFGYGDDSATITVGDNSKTPSASFNNAPASIEETSTVTSGREANHIHSIYLSSTEDQVYTIFIGKFLTQPKFYWSIFYIINCCINK